MAIAYFSIFITNNLAPFIKLSILSLSVSNDMCHIRAFCLCVLLFLGLLFCSSGLVFHPEPTECFSYYCFIISIVYNRANPSTLFFFKFVMAVLGH